jgi:chromosome segregation ATPase
MLEDLDSLATRIGQLAQVARQSREAHAASSQRVQALEAERNALRQQLADSQASNTDLKVKADSADERVLAVQQEAQRDAQALRQQLSQVQAENQSLRQLLESEQSQSSRLRFAAEQARSRIDSILVRLPGAQG